MRARCVLTRASGTKPKIDNKKIHKIQPSEAHEANRKEDQTKEVFRILVANLPRNLIKQPCEVNFLNVRRSARALEKRCERTCLDALIVVSQ